MSNVSSVTGSSCRTSAWQCSACGQSDVLAGLCLFFESCTGAVPTPALFDHNKGDSDLDRWADDGGRNLD